MQYDITSEFTFDGFKIRKPFEYSLDFSRKNGYLLIVRHSDPELWIYDSNCDGKAEEIHFGLCSERYKKGEKGTEAIFQKADELLARYMKELGVEEVKKEWEEKLGKYKTKEEYYSNIIKDM